MENLTEVSAPKSALTTDEQLTTFALLLAANGFDVILSEKPTSYFHFFKGTKIGYVQVGYYSGYSFSTVHQGSKEHGTGWQVVDSGELTLENANKVINETNNIPQWARKNRSGNNKQVDRVYYKDAQDYINCNAWANYYILKPEPKLNTTFKKEWTEAEFKQVEKAQLKHFRANVYQYIDNHSQPSKPFIISTYKQLDNALGLAYTSSGDYAGDWVCNGIYVMYNQTHHFFGFMINELGQVIAGAQDENENTVYIALN